MRTSITTRLVAVYILLLTGGAVASANLITNGDFETGTFAGWTVTQAASGTNISVANIPPAHDTLGAKFSATGSDFDSISQTFATTAGALYDLSFFYEVVEPKSPPDNEFMVFFNGVNIFDNADAISGFSPFTFTNLMATGPTTTVLFEARNPRGSDFLDDVSITRAGVPDTGASLALLAIGLIGLAATRRVLA